MKPETNPKPPPSATVVNIQRMSSEDGPGLRTTVFLKGCSLECSWCHNPEAVSAKPQLMWNEKHCINSGNCLAACPETALRRASVTTGGTPAGTRVVIDRERCTLCRACVESCPSAAFEVLGRRWSAADLFANVVKDREYFRSYGGGVTVSGGEPGLSASFVDAFLAHCRVRGIHAAVDTCGMCSPRALQTMVQQADLVLYDLKEIDPKRHREFTGQSNDRILANATMLGSLIRSKQVGARLWIRTPLIPRTTLREENILGIGEYIKRELDDVVERWELCAFNNLAADKYRRLGQHWQFENSPLLDEETLRDFEDLARRSGVNPKIVNASGPVTTACPRQREAAGA